MAESKIDDLTAARSPTIEVDGLRFRDLDHDGVLAPYEDWRLPIAERVDDLIGRMTLPEKAGMLLHGTLQAADGPLAALGVGDEYDLDAARALFGERGVLSAITRLVTDPIRFAEQNNRLQDVAASGRLGIPLTISSDPRHHVGEIFGASVAGGGFSAWPEPLGLGAIGDAETVRRFGDCVRREYRAVGIRMSLAPQADVGSSQPWPRISGTFGEDPELVGALAGAYVEGAQGGRNGLHMNSIACVVKHWVGYGAARDGFDGHNYYGRFSAFPADAFTDHVRAFDDAFGAGVAGVMPTYNILEGLEFDGAPVEPVGAGFSSQLIDGLLRTDYGFGGLVLSDWAITRDSSESCRTGVPPQGPDAIAMCWGVEHLTRSERFAKAINAGVDQLGGEDDPAPLLDAISTGSIDVRRVDDGVRRVLTQKFELGLFEHPFVDPVSARETVGTAESLAEGIDAQRRALVVLTGDQTPLLSPDDVVVADQVLAGPLRSRGVNVTEDISRATRAVALTATPYEILHPGHFFARMQHEGRLDFDPEGEEWERLDRLMSTVPTIVIVHMDRPAIVTPFVDRAAALLVELGVSAEVVADTLVGAGGASGRMPFRLFASMDDVDASPCDRPAGAPLFERGAGIGTNPAEAATP